MLTRVDRIQVATSDRRELTDRWIRLLDAELVREDRIKSLAAARSVLRVGTSEVELLEPDGEGSVSEQLSRRPGLFAAGFAVADLGALRSRLEARGIPYEDEGEQVFAGPAALGTPGLRVVLSQDQERPARGLLLHLYEVTYLAPDVPAAIGRIAAVFGLDDTQFVPIRSEQYGYAGALTLFHPDHLDRIEAVTPDQPDKTMGRFFAKFGSSLYVCYGDAARAPATRLLVQLRSPPGFAGEAAAV